MAIKALTFKCSDCGERLPLSRLSIFSQDLADADTPTEALISLPAEDVLCDLCAEDVDDDLSEPAPPYRNDVEAWEFSGLSIDPARLQAYYLSN